MIDSLTAAFLLLGSGFALIAAIGMVRMPDVFTRMHAGSKAGTFGVGLTMIAVALAFGDLGHVSRALATVGLLLLTAPVGAHLLSRAAYRDGARLWSGTVVDEKARTLPRDEAEYAKTVTPIASASNRLAAPADKSGDEY